MSTVGWPAAGLNDSGARGGRLRVAAAVQGGARYMDLMLMEANHGSAQASP